VQVAVDAAGTDSLQIATDDGGTHRKLKTLLEPIANQEILL
jgi:hypothetical protein